MTAPTIETPRLILRDIRPQDVEPYMAALARDDFARFITREGRGLDRAEAWRTTALVAGSWALCGFGNWAVVEKASGALIGRLGPWMPEGWPDFEIGWAIFPEYQRRGYASEGVAAAIRWSHDALGRDVFTHCILDENEPSQRLAASLGAERAGVWNPPWGGEVQRWETRWDRFITPPAYARLVAAGHDSA